MKVERPEIGPQQQSETQKLLSQYEGIYKESQDEVDKLTHAQARTKLEAFLKENDFQLPKEKQEILNDEQQLRRILAIGLAERRLKPIRDQILKKIDDDIKAAPVASQYNVLRKHFDELMRERNVDIVLVHDIISRLISGEADQLQQEYSQASKKPLLESGKKWLLDGGNKPSEFSVTPVPQLSVFGSFRLNVLYQEEFKDLRIKLGKEVNSIDEFVRETYPAYLKFIKTHNIDRSFFCPDQEFYKKLCTQSGISTEMLAGIDTSSVARSASFVEFKATQETNEKGFKEKQEFHEKEAERLKSEIAKLKAKSKKFREDDEADRATEIDLEVLRIEGEMKNHEKKAEEFEGLIDASQELTAKFKREFMSSEGARALFPNADYMENLPGARGYIGKFFAATSRGMDWVGRQIPDTGNPMSWNAGGMAEGLIKTGIAAGGLINLIKGLAPTYMGLHKTGAIALNPWNWLNPMKWKELLTSPKHLVKGMWDSTKEVGSFATAAATFASVKYGTMENIEKGVSWVLGSTATVSRKLANNEYTAYASHKIRDAAAYVAEHGPDAFKKYIFNNVKNAASEVITWPGVVWDAMKEIFNLSDEFVQKHRSFFTAMDSTEKHVKEQFRNSINLQRLGMTIDIASVSSNSFGALCQSYSARNRDHDQTSGILSLNLEVLADGGFLYLNGDKVTKEQLKENNDYKSIPEDERIVTINQKLSGELIKQADFWHRNYPDESKGRGEMTPTA
jgi:vacuolar-type H+-ATPase subunit F/Vma7